MKKLLSAVLVLAMAGGAVAQDLKLGGAQTEYRLGGQQKADPYKEAHDRAVREKKALVVWVGYVCLPCEKELQDCVHLRVETFEDAKAPAIVVGKPDARGVMWRLKDLPATASVEEIRNALRQPTETPPPPTQTYYQPRPFRLFQGGANCRT